MDCQATVQQGWSTFKCSKVAKFEVTALFDRDTFTGAKGTEGTVHVCGTHKRVLDQGKTILTGSRGNYTTVVGIKSDDFTRQDAIKRADEQYQWAQNDAYRAVTNLGGEKIFAALEALVPMMETDITLLSSPDLVQQLAIVRNAVNSVHNLQLKENAAREHAADVRKANSKGDD